MKTDIQIHQDVVAELGWDPRVNEKELGVAVKGGVFTLTGSVPSYAEKWAAETAIERVVGVKAVANDVVVLLPSAFATSDTQIAHRVADSLAWDIQVPDDKIKAAVTNAWVTLTGTVECSYQRDAAARAVRNLAGIRGVTNNIAVAAKRVSADAVSRNIKSALERRADHMAANITVETHDGVVTLKGTVPSYADRESPRRRRGSPAASRWSETSWPSARRGFSRHRAPLG
jgi:osmotically-inducible protein OsmY